jgi:hypothetical protein
MKSWQSFQPHSNHSTEVNHALVCIARPCGPDLERLYGGRFDDHVIAGDTHIAATDIHAAPAGIGYLAA